MTDPMNGTEPPAEDAATGLPSLCTWRAVYFAVGGVFILWVALLTALTWLYPAAP